MNGKKRSPPGIKVKYPFDSVPEEWGCTFETWKIFEFNKNFSSQHLTFLLYNTSQKPNLMFSLFWEKKKNFNFLMRIVFIYMLYSHQMLLHIRDEENKTLYIFHSRSLSLSLSPVLLCYFHWNFSFAQCNSIHCEHKIFALPSWAAVFLFMLWMTIRVAQSCRFLANKHSNPAKNAKKPFLNWPCLIYQSKDMHNNSKRLYSAGYWDEQPELQSHTVIIISLRTAWHVLFISLLW